MVREWPKRCPLGELTGRLCILHNLLILMRQLQMSRKLLTHRRPHHPMTVFPSSQHEDLPIVSEFTGNPSENEALEVSCAVKDDGVSDATYEEKVQEKSDAAALDESQFVEKAKSRAIDDIEFKEGKGLQGVDLVSEEEGIYVDPEFSAVNAGADSNGDEPTERSLGSPPQYAKLDEEENKIVPSCYCPCQRMWKRCAERLSSGKGDKHIPFCCSGCCHDGARNSGAEVAQK